MNAATLAPIFRTARKTRQLSQQTLAEKAGLSRKSIGEFEKGRLAELGLGRFLAICDSLGLEMQLLPKDLILADELAALRSTATRSAASGKFEQRKRQRDLELSQIRARSQPRR